MVIELHGEGIPVEQLAFMLRIAPETVQAILEARQ